MDRNWMYLEDRLCKDYRNGVKSFLNMASRKVNAQNETRCPCQECMNIRSYGLGTIEDHLFRHGFSSNYKEWIFRGEETKDDKRKPEENPYDVFDDSEDEDEDEDVPEIVPLSLDRIVEHLAGEGSCAKGSVSDAEASGVANLSAKADSPLYPGATMGTLEFMTKLMHLKINHSLSDESFDMLLPFLNDTLLDGATKLPGSYHDAQKFLLDIGSSSKESSEKKDSNYKSAPGGLTGSSSTRSSEKKASKNKAAPGRLKGLKKST